jgi:hypothetical protein
MRRKPDSNILVMQAEADHQSPSSAGAAGGGNRLGFSGETLELGVSRGGGPEQPPTRLVAGAFHAEPR